MLCRRFGTSLNASAAKRSPGHRQIFIYRDGHCFAIVAIATASMQCAINDTDKSAVKHFASNSSLEGTLRCNALCFIRSSTSLSCHWFSCCFLNRIPFLFIHRAIPENQTNQRISDSQQRHSKKNHTHPIGIGTVGSQLHDPFPVQEKNTEPTAKQILRSLNRHHRHRHYPMALVRRSHLCTPDPGVPVCVCVCVCVCKVFDFV